MYDVNVMGTTPGVTTTDILSAIVGSEQEHSEIVR